MAFKSSRYLLVALLWGLLSGVQVAAAPARVGTIEGAKPVSPVVAEIGQQIQELVTGNPEVEIEPEETFGTRALGLILNTTKRLAEEGERSVNNFTPLTQFIQWYNDQKANEAKSRQWEDTEQTLLLALVSAFLARWGAMLVLYPAMKRLQKKRLMSVMSRIGAAIVRLVLMMVPVLVFLGVALFVVDQTQSTGVPRFLVMSAIYALTLFHVLRVVLRLLFAPQAEPLRLVPFSTPHASFIKRWGDWYGGILIFGMLVAGVAKTLKIPDDALSGFKGLLALIIVGMTIAIILQKRSAVSIVLKGQIPFYGAHTLWQALRLWFARVWHILAIGYLVVGFFVTILDPESGLVVIQQGTIGTLLVLLLMRLSFHWMAGASAGKGADKTATSLWRPVFTLIWRLATWLAGLAAIGAVWGLPVADIVASPWGQRFLGSAFSITTTVVVLVAIYELIRHAIDRKLNLRDAQGNIIEADARSRTLLPLVHNAALFLLFLIAGLVTLSELGVDTSALLAGAGILGIALGFGSQTLVKDFLTGLFILIEGSMAVGDVVKLGDHSGVVEGMTIRTVKLRDMKGTLHIIPFGDITRIMNLTKDFSYAVLDAEVAYESDLDHVTRTIKKVGEEMGQDEELKPDIIEPLEVLGITSLGTSSITIRSRIKTRAGGQWNVQRAFLWRIKKAFDAEGIEIPFPHVVYVQKGQPATVPEPESNS